MALTQLLESFKGINKFTPNQINLLLQTLAKKNIHQLSLWRINKPFLFFNRMFKLQIFFLAFYGLTVVPYKAYQKYNQNPQRLNELLAKVGAYAFIVSATFFVYKKFVRRIITMVSYDLKKNKILLINAEKGKKFEYLTNQVSYVQDKKIIKAIIVNPQDPQKKIQYSIEGAGTWSSKEIFKLIIEMGQLASNTEKNDSQVE